MFAVFDLTVILLVLIYRWLIDEIDISNINEDWVRQKKRHFDQFQRDRKLFQYQTIKSSTDRLCGIKPIPSNKRKSLEHSTKSTPRSVVQYDPLSSNRVLILSSHQAMIFSLSYKGKASQRKVITAAILEKTNHRVKLMVLPFVIKKFQRQVVPAPVNSSVSAPANLPSNSQSFSVTGSREGLGCSRKSVFFNFNFLSTSWRADSNLDPEWPTPRACLYGIGGNLCSDDVCHIERVNAEKLLEISASNQETYMQEFNSLRAQLRKP